MAKEMIPQTAENKTEKRPNIFVRAVRRIVKFFRESASELKKVTWLSKNETVKSTVVVAVSVIVFSVAIAVIDLVSSNLLELVRTAATAIFG